MFLSTLCFSFVHGETHLIINICLVDNAYCVEIPSRDLGVATSPYSCGVYNDKSMDVFSFSSSIVQLRSIGQTFKNVLEFQIELMKHIMQNGYQINMLINKPCRVFVTRKMKNIGFGWVDYARHEYSFSNTFIIKSFLNIYTCGFAFVDIYKYHVSSKLVKSVVIDLVKICQETSRKEIIDCFV